MKMNKYPDITIDSNLLGKVGEDITKKLLEKEGYKVRDFRCFFLFCPLREEVHLNADKDIFGQKCFDFEGETLESCPRGEAWYNFMTEYHMIREKHDEIGLSEPDYYAEKDNKKFVVEVKSTHKYSMKRLERSVRRNEGKVLQLARKYGLIPLVAYLRFKVHLIESTIKSLP